MARKNPFFYGWYIAGVGAASYALGYGSRFSFSVIFPALLEEFKWPRDSTASMLSIHILIYGIMAPLAGYLVDRAGPRKTMITGVSLQSVGLILSSFGSQIWHFWIGFGLISGVGLCMIGSVPFTTVVRNWFERKRGMALSILFFGSGGAYACYPAIAWLISHTGWRNTFLVEGVILAGVLIPLFAVVVRYHPRELGLTRDGIPEAKPAGFPPSPSGMQIVNPQWASVDWTLGKAVHTRQFWLICLTTFSVWGILQGVVLTHHIAFAVDVGYSKIYASSVLSLFGLTYAFGTLGSLISDRLGREVTITIGVAIGMSGLAVLLLIQDASHPWMLFYFAIALGFSNGLCSPAIAASITDIFQGPRVGSVVGAVWFAFAVGGTIGPWLGGWLFELSGDYFLAFLIAMTLFGVGCGAIWLAAPRKIRRVSLPSVRNTDKRG